MKNILAAIGVLTVVVGFVVWQNGFFYRQFKSISTKIDRATAVSRAEMMIEKTKTQADSLQKKSHDMKVKARKMELGTQRDEDNLVKVEYAVKQLAQTLKKAGYPKPSEFEKLTDKQKHKKIVFAGREGTAADAFNQIRKWNAEYYQKKSVLDAKRKLIAKLKENAELMISKQDALYAEIEKIKVQLANLEAEREIAAINAEISELGGTEVGINMGEFGSILDIIQDEIDELNAQTDVANTEVAKMTNGDFFPKQDLPTVSNQNDSLDVFWD